MDILARHVPRSGPVALIDYPAHRNVGDAAIWLGELAALRKGGWELAYACTEDGYDAARIRERIGPDGTVLLHGGGNLGDLYPAHQHLRLRVLSELRDRRIVQLPQTACFRHEPAIERAAPIFAAHPDLTVLCRDGPSERLVAERLGSRTALCPDAAFALGALERTERPATPVLVLAREDFESALPGAPPTAPDVGVADWPRRDATPTRIVLSLLQRTGAWRGYELVSRRLLRSGVRLLSRGEAVVTDRLHGHILCLLLAIPHVVVPDRFGKVASFHATWGTGTPIVDGAAGLGVAIDRARGLVG